MAHDIDISQREGIISTLGDITPRNDFDFDVLIRWRQVKTQVRRLYNYNSELMDTTTYVLV